MTLNESLENITMGIIANAGASRADAFEALKEAKKGHFKRAYELIEESKKYASDAHAKHSELLAMYANGEVEYSDLLISHAQDHLMCAELARELITEIIELREQQKGGK